MAPGRDRRVLRIGIEQRQAEIRRQVEGEESGRQQAPRHVRVGRTPGRARRALLRDRGEAVIGRDDDVGGVGEPEGVERGPQRPEIVVGVLDRGERRGPVVLAGRLSATNREIQALR
jgi:hypothetical protein